MSVDHDLLADYVGGALDGTPEQERVASLIASSPDWCHAAEELTAALHGVQHDLNVLRETPEPMPEDVAARFDGLFDGPKRDPLEPRLVTQRSARAVGRAGAKRWKRWVAPVAIAGAAFGVYALGQVPSIVSPAMNDSADGSARLSAEAPAAAPQATVPTIMTGHMYDRASVASASVSGVYGNPSTDNELRTQTEKGGDATASPWQRLLDPAARQRCLNAVNTVLPGKVELVEYAYFEGSPALVISITANNGQWRFVAGGNCGLPGPDEKFQTPLK